MLQQRCLVHCLGATGYWLRCLLAVTFLFCAVHAQASVPAAAGWRCGSNTSQPLGATPADACRIAAGANTPLLEDLTCWAGVPGIPKRFGPFSCQKAGQMCPPNSTMSGGSCVCNSGYDESNNQCVKKDSCEANFGKSGIVNVTIGWKYKDFGGGEGDYTKSNYVGGQVNFPDISKPVCSGGCMAVFDQDKPYDGAFHSTVPNSATGLYRVSVDANVTYGNRMCTAEENDTPNSKAASKETEDEKCDGDVGTIQLGDQPSKKVCVPRSDKPVPGTGENVPKKPSDGSTKPEDKGNPSAGPKPSTGEGSGTGGGGRTPTVGTGGNRGGPGGASKPGGGTGGTGGGTGGEEGGEKDKGGSCGGKDQPPCKIDETGTPDGSGAFDQANADLAAIDAARDSTLGGITNSEGKDTSWGTTFGWVNHGGCAPWMLGTLPAPINKNIEVDICEIEKYTSPIVSFLWIITTVAMCAGLVFSAVSGSKQ